MKNCKEIKDRLLDYLYDDLEADEKTSLENHFISCNKCSTLLSEYKSLLNITQLYNREEPSFAYNKLKWKDIRKSSVVPIKSKTSVEKAFKYRSIFINVPIRRALSTAALLLIGFLIGWMLFSPSSNEIMVKDTGLSEISRISNVDSANRLIDRSRVIILGICNFDVKSEDASVLNLNNSRKRSLDLVQEAKLLQKNLNNTKDIRLKELIDDLEYVLLQLANMENKYDIHGIEIIQSGIKNRGILLKIDLYELSKIGNKKVREKPIKNTI